MPERCQKFKHRSYSSIHALSWAISLERYGYTNCMFRDCNFMALDLDAMAFHHYECPGGGSNESLFMCDICKRGTSDKITLNNHYFLAHPEEARALGISSVTFTQTMPKILSNVRKKSWELYLERKGYIKCLIQNCQFITDEISVMKDHYYQCSTGLSMGTMSYTCPTCSGVTNNQEFFERHCNKCIKLTVKPPDYFAPRPQVTLEMVNLWTENIRKFKAAKCARSGCRFIDNNVMALKTHFVRCKTIPNPVHIICHICGGWLNSNKKLEEHLQSVHKTQEKKPIMVLILQDDNNENNFKYAEMSRAQLVKNENLSFSLYSSGDEDNEDINYNISEDAAEEENTESPVGNGSSVLKQPRLKTYQKSSHKKAVHPSLEVLIPGVTRKIDYVKSKQLSSIQYGKNFLEKNSGLMNEINVSNEKRRRRCLDYPIEYEPHSREMPKSGSFFAPVNNISNKTGQLFHNFKKVVSEKKTTDLTPLAKIAKKLMCENKELPVPVNISVEDKSWTVGVTPSVIGGPKLTGNIIEDFNSIGQYMRREANLLLNSARTKNTIRNQQPTTKRYQTRYREQYSLPKHEFNVFWEDEEEEDEENESVIGKSKGNIGVISHSHMVNFNRQISLPTKAGNEDHIKLNKRNTPTLLTKESIGKITNLPSGSRSRSMNSENYVNNREQAKNSLPEVFNEDTESDNDDVSDDIQIDTRQPKTIADGKKNINQSVINVEGRPLIFDDKELEITLLNPTCSETSEVNSNCNSQRKSTLHENDDVFTDILVLSDCVEENGEEDEVSQEENIIIEISEEISAKKFTNEKAINKEILKNIANNTNEVLNTEVSIMPLSTKKLGERKKMVAKDVSVKENSLITTNHVVSKNKATKNGLFKQKISSPLPIGTNNTTVNFTKKDDWPIIEQATDLGIEESFAGDSTKIDFEKIEKSLSISSDLFTNLNGKPMNDFTSHDDQELTTLKKGTFKKYHKKGGLKKNKLNSFLGGVDKTSSCNKLNHLLSYCNILGITAELQTYPIHVKFDVTANKPGNSNNVDSKANNNRNNKESSSNEKNSEVQEQSDTKTKKNPDENPSNASKKRKVERKSGKGQKSNENQSTTKKGDSHSENLGEEYNSFVGTVGKSSTPFVKRNEKKSGNTNVDSTPDSSNVRNETEESSMSTKISRNDSVQQNQTDATCAEREKPLKKGGNESESHGKQTAKGVDTEESKKDNNDKNKDQPNTRRRRNEKPPNEPKEDADNESIDTTEDGPAKKKGRLESTEEQVSKESVPKGNEATESRKSILTDYLKTRNHSASGEVQSLTKRKRGRPRKTHVPSLVDVQTSIPSENPNTSEKENSESVQSENNQPVETLDNGNVPSEEQTQLENMTDTSQQDSLDVSMPSLKMESNLQESDLKSESNHSQEEYTSAHLPPSPPPVKRKPGRPRKNPLPTRIFDSGMDVSGSSGEQECGDPNDASNNRRGPFGRPRRPSLSKQPAASADTVENLDRVDSCAICKESMTIRDFQKKHFMIHNFMCWMDGDDPLDVECENTMVNWLIRWKKKYPKHLFKCEKCGETKKSVKGFLSHIQFCGKTLEERQKLMVACPLCGRVMMPSSLEQHRPLCSKKAPPKEAVAEIALSTRKAAKQCLETLADLAPNLLAEGKSKKRKRNDTNFERIVVDSDEDFLQGDDDVAEFEREEVKNLYTLKTKRSTKHLRTIWELAVADGKVLHCPCPSCEFSTLTYNEMNEHYRTCQFDFQGYVCKDCRYTSISERDMVMHIKTVHIEHVQMIKEGVKVPHSTRRDDMLTGSQIFIPFLKKAEVTFSASAKVSKFFRPALSWTQQQRALNYTTESIFPEYKFIPEVWQELDLNSIEAYLPEKKLSVKFSSRNRSYWSHLKLFESRILSERMCIMFTGGPVWGLAWAPGSTDVQYLAVSTHLSMHSNFRMGSVHAGPGVVQIWALRNLNNFGNTSDGQVKLEYVFCHDYGGCWALEWCPAGCQDDTRIGLLAIATTSGVIPLFAVPTPQGLSAALNSENVKHYKPEPALLLKLSPFVNSQCTRLSWSKVKPHRSIVAGFTNGVIGVWDLNSQSVLLRSGNTLYPYKTFSAHHSNITGLCLSPASETYLVSSALDKTVKFWDLNDTTAPHTIHRRGLVNDVAWMQHWLCAVAVYDESYMTSQATAALHSVRDYTFQPSSFISNVKSSAWCVSANDWLNAVAISYDNGQITVAFAKQQDPNNEKRDEKKKLVKVVLQTSLFDFDKNMPLSSNNELIEEAAGGNANNSSNVGNTSADGEQPSTSSVDQYEPRTVDCCTFEEVSEKYGVLFDCDINFKKENLLKGNQANPIDIYPIMSANKVTWNPNMDALLTMAIGYQSGFVVIPKLTLPTFDEKFLESFIKTSKGNET
ncbi:uncharacterized protein isoform X3 [Rhodnius prolixus]